MSSVVLVIDFEPRSAANTKTFLEGKGCEVVVAGTTKELEAFVAKETPALVILEPMLPGLDGFRFIRQLKGNKKDGKAPVVIAASRIFKGQRYKAMAREAGADLVLERPQDDPVLLAAVEKTAGEAPAPAAAAKPMQGGATFPVDIPPSAAPVPANEPELDKLVDQMFDACFESGPVPVQPAAAKPAAVAAPAAAHAPAAAAVAVAEPAPQAAAAPVAVAAPAPQAAAAPAPKPEPVAPAPKPAAPAPKPEPVASAPKPVAAAPKPEPVAPKPAAKPVSPAATVKMPAPAAEAPKPAEDFSPRFSGMLEASEKKPLNPLIKKYGIPAGAGLAAVIIIAALVMGGGKKSAPAAPAETAPAAPTAATPAPAAGGETAAGTPAAAAPTAATPAATAATDPKQAKKDRDALKKAEADKKAGKPETSAAPAVSEPAPAPTQAAAAAPAPAPAPAPAVAAPAPAPAPVVAQSAPAPAARPAAEPEPPMSGPFIPGANGVSQPRLVNKVEPSYPEVARSRKIGGEVTLQLTVLADGSVGGVKVLRDPGAGLGAAAANAAKKWRYRPGMMKGRAVDTLITERMRFNP